MSRDRWGEFQNAASRRPPTYAAPAAQQGYAPPGQMEMGMMPTAPAFHPNGGGGPPPQMPQQPGGGGGGSGDPASAAFFDKLASAQDVVQEIRTTLSQVDYLHRKALDVMTDAQSKQAQSQLDALISDTTRSASTARSKIKELNQLIPKMNQSDAQIARTQLQAIKTKFMNTMTEFQDIETKYRNQMRGRLERQYRIVNPNASQEEVENVLAQDQGAQLFAQNVLQSNPYGQARDALREVQERHEDIKKIEKTILDLHQLFQDMATMVEAQSETVQVIATQVEQTEQYTEAANKEIGEAIEVRKRTRKKLWILCGLCVFLILIIAVALWFYVIQPLVVGADAVSGGSDAEAGADGAGAAAGEGQTAGAEEGAAS